MLLGERNVAGVVVGALLAVAGLAGAVVRPYGEPLDRLLPAALAYRRRRRAERRAERRAPELAARVRRVSVVGIDQVDSESDPRVQIADVLAGAGRAAALFALDGAADTQLVEALQPYVDEWSLWSDDRSWQALTGRSAVGAL